jgi:hypothetical protein
VTTKKLVLDIFSIRPNCQPRVSRSSRHTQVMLQTVTLFYIHCGPNGQLSYVNFKSPWYKKYLFQSNFLLLFGIWQPGSILVMLCKYQDNCLENLIYRPYGHFTYLRQRQTSGRKVFHLSMNFTHHLTYDTRVVYGLCCATYRIIT